ncbi:TSSC1 [Cordylochernes scorpioides]|uniref:TSSC1 n=1 Tax=Cordylochernes scorpioides TaxID=51811 RepID=A0ABY6KFB3_9ARAC|nr:TSSC1 [Cordylochernes scorpioides]
MVSYVFALIGTTPTVRSCSFASNKLVSWTTVEDTKSNFVSVRWNPHQNCSLVAATIGSDVRSYDLRSMKHLIPPVVSTLYLRHLIPPVVSDQCGINLVSETFNPTCGIRPAWQIHKAHSQQARELDFNPNKQYYLATCGDDCLTKFWDCRNPTSPVLTLSNHSHWYHHLIDCLHYSLRFKIQLPHLALKLGGRWKDGLNRWFLTATTRVQFPHWALFSNLKENAPMTPDSCKTPPASASNQTGLWHICKCKVELLFTCIDMWCTYSKSSR